MKPVPEVAEVTPDQVSWFRLRRSGLVEPFPDAVTAAASLGGIQAQVLRSAGLSLSARVPGPFTKSSLETVLYRDRSLVKLWGHRRTLHLYEPNDWPLIFSLFEKRTSWTEMVTRKLGGDTEAIARGARDIVARLKEPSVDTRSRKLMRAERPDLAPYLDLGIGLFMDVAQTGDACHAKPVGSESHFAHREKWLPALEWDPPGRDDAGVALTRRCLEAYGPATPQDVAFWLGEKVTDARRWLARLAPELSELDASGTRVFVRTEDLSDLCAKTPPRRSWPTRLLHRYDVLVLAHKDKGWLIAPEHYKRVWKAAGVVDAVVLVGGKVVGVWKYALKTRSVRITVVPFGKLSVAVKKSIGKEALRVAAHLELSLDSLEFE